MTARSYLFVPGDRADMLAKAGERGADAVIADLEDAVAPSRRPAAREMVASWLELNPTAPFERWVRINSDDAEADLLEIVGPGLTGVMVPKLESAEKLARVAARLAGIGETPAGIKLLPIIETARGLLAAPEIASVPRVHQLMIGEFDLAADLGLTRSDEAAFIPLRMQVVVASAASGIAPPLGPVSADYRDLDAFRDSCRLLASLGFAGRPAIHPAQVPIINEEFGPDPDDVERAMRVIALYEEAVAEGRGALTDEDGRMIDEAVVKIARRTLSRHGESPDR